MDEEGNCQGHTIVPRGEANAAPERGVYFLANDAILDLTIAFLNSFRLSNPVLPLCLIPFGNDIDELRKLSKIYDFSIYENLSSLQRCDKIALKFFDWPCGHFRKLCCFDGPFEEFIYIDCDTVVLRDVYFVFQYLDYFDFVFSHSDSPGLRQWVWKDTICVSGLLNERQIALSANTGFFCARKGGLSLDGAEAISNNLEDILPHLCRVCGEQPFLNYLIVTSNQRYTSLAKLHADTDEAWNLPLERWAGERYLHRKNEDVLLVHWAGCWSASPRDKAIYAFLSKFGIKLCSTGVRLMMPHKKLWKYYRYYPYRNMSRILQSE